MDVKSARTLKMKFATDGGKTVSVQLQNCKDDLTQELVSDKMNELIDKQFYSFEPTAAAGADVIERTVKTLF